MNCEQLLHSWNIKKNATTCSCLIITNPKDILLFTDKVNEIIIPFKGNSLTNLLQVNNHMNEKPWRVISEYLYFNERTQSLSIPIITSIFQQLRAGEAICHIFMMDSIQSLQERTGKNSIYQKKSVYL